MAAEITVLVMAALLGGLIGWRFVPGEGRAFQAALVFSGAYLFSLTIIHLIPELFESSEDVPNIAIFILIGFFLQVVLEFFTDGVEHGHIHVHNHGPSSTYLVLAMCLHALLDGTILSQHALQHAHVHNGANALLIGLALHKIPAALALLTLLKARKKPNSTLTFVLVVFTLSSPTGLLLSDWMADQSLISETNFVRLFALVSGTFLQISTTIFFESTPSHKPQKSKLMASLAGATLAVLSEMFL
ncbi:MAG TPA: zinc permease [Cytophagales bacterium]|nr:zinc permease [Cytophagales bacterium]HAA20913.1 zinc permease [Cytophagales bacterium]HAP60597.1 zinc permease [Cytophagales bacterium]